MKLDNAIELSREGFWTEVQIRMSPQNSSEWFLMLHDNDDKSYILADNDDKAISTDDLNELMQLVRLLGLKKFTTYL